MQASASYQMDELRPAADPRVGVGVGSPQRPNASEAARTASANHQRWSFKRFWLENVDCMVDFDKCRDHLALERTFLAYLRTALMSAMFGTLVAQLFILEQEDSGFGYTAVGRPLASLCFLFSICTVVMGTYRAWRYQHAMINGKALSGGFEIVVLAVMALAMIVIFFGFLIAIDAIKDKTTPA